MYSVDWNLFTKRILPWWKRKQKFMDWLQSLMKPLQELHIVFLEYVEATFYKLSITSQIIYLEKLLNDKFNSGLPARAVSSTVGLYDGTPTGIYITDPDTFIFPLYIWNKIEQRPKTFIYNKWDASIYYIGQADTGTGIGEFAVDDGKVWQATQTNINARPSTSPIKWSEYAELTYLHNKEEFEGEYDAVVHIPTAVGDVNDVTFISRVKSEVNVYRIAGKRFQYVNY